MQVGELACGCRRSLSEASFDFAKEVGEAGQAAESAWREAHPAGSIGLSLAH